jgi:hypothetical protein
MTMIDRVDEPGWIHLDCVPVVSGAWPTVGLFDLSALHRTPTRTRTRCRTFSADGEGGAPWR